MTKKISDLSSATTPLGGGELVEIVQSGVSKKVAASYLAGAASARERLTGNRSYYVRSDGSDSNDGLANTSGGAFLTIQKAIDTVCGDLDLSTYNAYIYVGDATRTTGIVLKRYVSSGGVILIVGNSATPANCVISTTSADCISTNDYAGLYSIDGFKLNTTTAGTALLSSGLASYVSLKNMDFGACATAHISVANNSSVVVDSNYSITGGAPWHFGTFSNGSVTVSGKTITLTGTPAFGTAFALAQTSSLIVANGNTFSGSATGARYNVSLNAVAFTAGGGINYFPGNSAGSTATGGQYA